MANDYQIPQPKTASTNIPSGGAARVSFNPSTGSNPFAGLSQTIAHAAQTTSNFRAHGEALDKAHADWKDKLDTLHGLVGTGGYTEEDYKKVVREANAKAQKEGSIKAHENWSTVSAVEEERAKILSDALDADLKSQWGAITNPDKNFRLSLEDAEQSFLDAREEDGAGKIVGYDTYGNPVSTDMVIESSNPMELIAFQKKRVVSRSAIAAAREDVLAARVIEGRTRAVQEGLSSDLTDFAKSRASADERISISSEAVLLGKIKDKVNKAYDEGVTDINSVVMTTVQDFVTDVAETAEYGDAVMNDGLINRIISLVQTDLSFRKDEKGNKVMFAAQGTENNRKLDGYRKSALNTYALRMKGEGNEQALKEKVFWAFARVELSKVKGSPLDEGGKAAFNAKMLDKLDELKVADASSAMRDIDGLLGRVVYMPEEEMPDVDELGGLGIRARTEQWDTATERDAFMYSIVTSGKELGLSSSKIDALIGLANTNFNSQETARASGVKLNPDVKSIHNRILSSYADRDKLEKRIEDTLVSWQSKGGMEATFAKLTGVTGVTVDADLVSAMLVEVNQLLSEAEVGGKVKKKLMSEIFSEADLKTVKNRIGAASFSEIEAFFNPSDENQFEFPPLADMTPSDARDYSAYVQNRIAHMAKISAAIQDKKIGESMKITLGNLQGQTTPSSTRANWLHYVKEAN